MPLFTQRPGLKGRNSSGQEVSLLSTQPSEEAPVSRPISMFDYALPTSRSSVSYSTDVPRMARMSSNESMESNISVPSLPRSNSFDSYATNEVHSPITPTYSPYGRNDSYSTQHGKSHNWYERDTMDEYHSNSSLPPLTHQAIHTMNVQQQYPEGHFHDNDSYHAQSERVPEKRYPCRFRESHNCIKTFTTSGHASRHSKIHSAEKMVRCTYPGGCPKKFTRADNMKQHLETHYKDKPRSAASNGKSLYTASARVHKRSTSSVGYRSPQFGASRQTLSPDIIYSLPTDQYNIVSSSPLQPFNFSPRAQDQLQDHPSSQSASQPHSLSLPTRSKGPKSSLDLLADCALN